MEILKYFISLKINKIFIPWLLKLLMSGCHQEEQMAISIRYPNSLDVFERFVNVSKKPNPTL